jgi:hypothetical protein
MLVENPISLLRFSKSTGASANRLFGLTWASAGSPGALGNDTGYLSPNGGDLPHCFARRNYFIAFDAYWRTSAFRYQFRRLLPVRAAIQAFVRCSPKDWHDFTIRCANAGIKQKSLRRTPRTSRRDGNAVVYSAWTVDYWQAWVFLALFGVSALAITFYLMKKNPKFLERRVYAGPTAERERNQKIIQSITSIGFIAMLVIPALDHHFHWSQVPIYASVAGDLLVAMGFSSCFLCTRKIPLPRQPSKWLLNR